MDFKLVQPYKRRKITASMPFNIEYYANPSEQMTKVCDNFFVGSLADAYNQELLQSNKITHILNVASEINIVERVNHKYAKYGVDDDCDQADISNIMKDALSFVKCAIEEGGTVLVHCLEGKSRSVCVAIAYIVLLIGINFDECVEYIKRERPQVDIFPLYLAQTREYCKKSVPWYFCWHSETI